MPDDRQCFRETIKPFLRSMPEPEQRQPYAEIVKLAAAARKHKAAAELIDKVEASKSTEAKG